MRRGLWSVWQVCAVSGLLACSTQTSSSADVSAQEVAETTDSDVDVKDPLPVDDASDAAMDSSWEVTVTSDTESADDVANVVVDATTPSDAAVTGDGACFHGGPPGPDAEVADIPQPDVASCTWPKPKFFSASPPETTLSLEVGTHDPLTGGFVPYQDGQWLPMVHGPQGGFHVFAAVRVKLPNQEADVVKLQSEAIAFAGCEAVAYGQQPVVFVKPTPMGYTTASLSHAGTLVIFPVQSKDSWKVCGTWIELLVRVKDVSTGQWGQTQVAARLYDTKNAPISP